MDYDQTEEWGRTYFSEIPVGTGTINRPTVTEPRRTEETRDVVYDNIPLPAVIQAYNLPPQKHKDNNDPSMHSTYPTAGKTSLMTKEAEQRQKQTTANTRGEGAERAATRR